MLTIEKLLLMPLVLSAIVTYAATPMIIKLAWKLNLVDDPKINKHPKVIHAKPTARGGGIAIFISILVSAIVFLPLDKHLGSILLGAAIITGMGVLDDKYNLNPYLRLTVQFVAAAIPILSGIGIPFVTNPFGGLINLSEPSIGFSLLGETRSIWIISDLFALFWIVTLMNFLNMGAKGTPGQLTGVVGIAAIAVALLSLKFSADITEWPVITLAGITAGAFLGGLPWHMFPQRIMPSFSGSNLAGYLLAILSILTTTKIGLLGIVLAVPLVDTSYTIVRRILSGKSPVWGDRGHLHHKLLDAGLTQKQVTYFYWVSSILLGIIALNLNGSIKLYTMFALSLFLVTSILWISKTQK